jgi:hypothetical protein
MISNETILFIIAAEEVVREERAAIIAYISITREKNKITLLTKISVRFMSQKHRRRAFFK